MQTLGKLTPQGYAQIQGIGEARTTLISSAMDLVEEGQRPQGSKKQGLLLQGMCSTGM